MAGIVIDAAIHLYLDLHTLTVTVQRLDAQPLA